MLLKSIPIRSVARRRVALWTIRLSLFIILQGHDSAHLLHGGSTDWIQVPCGSEQDSKVRPIEDALTLESDLKFETPVNMLGVWLMVGPGDSSLDVSGVADPDQESESSLQTWQIRTEIDQRALERAGIDVAQIAVRQFYGTGICRRSALRLILAEASLGYVVQRDQIVLTTKQTADSWGDSLSERPKVLGLRDDDLSIRRKHTFIAGNCRLNSDVFLPTLILGLKDEDRDIRFNAAFAIAAFGANAEGAVDELIVLLRGDDLTMRQAAVYSLSQIGKPAIDDLLVLAEDRDAQVAQAAISALGKMGIMACGATDELIAVATRHINSEPQIHGEDCVRCRAIAETVAQICTGENLNVIAQLLRSQSSGERAFAAYVIGNIGSCESSFDSISTESIEEAVEALLFDNSVAVRRAAAWAIANFDTPIESMTESLERASGDVDRMVAIWAKAALVKMRSDR